MVILNGRGLGQKHSCQLEYIFQRKDFAEIDQQVALSSNIAKQYTEKHGI